MSSRSIGCTAIAVCLAALLFLSWQSLVKREVGVMFPQNENCQDDEAAIAVRLPPSVKDRRSAPDGMISVTNCRRIGFQFFLSDSEITDRAIWLTPGGYWAERLVGGQSKRDLIVHVSHVQPAAGLSDPTIATNLYLLAFAHELQRYLARFSGDRRPFGSLDLDEFFPFEHPAGRVYLLSREGADPSLIARCLDGICEVLAYSKADGLVFTLFFPFESLPYLTNMTDRTLALLRSWRVADR